MKVMRSHGRELGGEKEKSWKSWKRIGRRKREEREVMKSHESTVHDKS